MRKRFTLFLLLNLFTICLASSGQTVPALGDVNSDGMVNIVDALMVAQYSVGLQPAPFSISAADVNGDGLLTIVDALLIAQYSVGIIKQFPAETGGVETAQSALHRNINPQITAEERITVVQGNNQFAFDCYKTLSAQEGNLFFSPLSVTYAFAMCYAGASGNTYAEMGNVLHFLLPESGLHRAFNALELTITTPPEAVSELKFFMANSSWGQKGYTFMPKFLDTLAVNYGAGLNLVDYINAPEPARVAINNWVADKTEQRIKDLLPQGVLTTNTRLVLTNAVYFKANWVNEFLVANTTSAPFTNLDGSIVEIPLMRNQATTNYYEVAGQYQAIELPYQGTKKNSMVIIVPAAGQFQSVEAGLSLVQFSAIYQSMTEYDVHLALPQFGYEWSASLKPALQAQGMHSAFIKGTADFSRINGLDNLYISDVLHKAFITVNEKGTEAAASTAVIIINYSLPPIAVLTINRPFLYFIINTDTKAILFAGRVVQL